MATNSKSLAKKSAIKKATTKKSSAKKAIHADETQTQRAQRLAFEILKLKKNKDGLPHGELVTAIQEKAATEGQKIKPNTIVGAVVGITKARSDIIKEEGWGAPYRLKAYSEKEAEEAAEEEEEAEKEETKERSFYKPFRDWLLIEERCETAASTGDSRKGKRGKWMIPDVIGKRERRLVKKIILLPEITSAEIKYETSWNMLIQGFGQACAYKAFSHRSYLVIPKQTKVDHRRRLDYLCQLFGIGYVLYDRDSKPGEVVFQEIIRPQPHDPNDEELEMIDEMVEWDKNGRTLENYLDDK